MGEPYFMAGDAPRFRGGINGPRSSLLDGKLSEFQPRVAKVSNSAGAMDDTGHEIVESFNRA